MKDIYIYPRNAFAFATLVLGFALILTACGSESTSTEPGQALVRVDGEEITVIQLNDELGRNRVQADQVEQARKQLLESMIDIQLMVAEAQREKLDRAPNVMRAIERAKKQIIAQSYMQTTLSRIDDPTEEEINQFYQEHPELFAQRKKYNLPFIRFSSEILNDEFKSVIDSAKSLSDVVQWLDKHQISYFSDEMIQTTTDMPPQVATRLQNTQIGEMFLVHENANATSILVSVKNIEQDPVTFEDIRSRITTHLLINKRRETAQDAIARLRAAADIEYLHDQEDTDSSIETDAQSPSTTPLIPQQEDKALDNILLQDESIERGISGLK